MVTRITKPHAVISRSADGWQVEDRGELGGHLREHGTFRSPAPDRTQRWGCHRLCIGGERGPVPVYRRELRGRGGGQGLLVREIWGWNMSGAQRNVVFYGVFLYIVLACLIVAVRSRQKSSPTAGTAPTGTIQSVIDNASSGDSIFLAGETYTENIVIDRSLEFGALDSADPPRIVTSGASPGVTLSADGITINGITILGNASTGLLVLSDNNRISGSTIAGHGTGVAFRSASHNVLSGNVIEDNGVGIDLDRRLRFQHVLSQCLQQHARRCQPVH